MPHSQFPESNTDRTLLGQYRRGQADAATELYARYAARLLELAKRRTGAELGNRVEPEDVVQSVFRTFFRRAAEGSYQVPDGDTLWKLLMVIALNKIRSLADYHRADKRDMRRTHAISEVPPEQHERESLNILQMTIEDMTSEMHESHRQMIRMRIEGFSVDEIAAAVQRSKRTTERVLQSFREQLFAQLHGSGVAVDDGPIESVEL